MQPYRALIVFCSCALLCHAQPTKSDPIQKQIQMVIRFL
jgi:hypothetical protein